MTHHQNTNKSSAWVLGSLLALTTFVPLPTFAQPNSGPVAKESADSGRVAEGSTEFSTTDRFAVVNANCTFSRKFGAVSCTKAGVGNYVIRFNKNVRPCYYTATIGLGGAIGTEVPGFITVVGAAADATGVFVTTDNISGVSEDRGFHLLVSCRF